MSDELPRIVLRSVQVRYIAPDGQRTLCPLDAAGAIAFEECLPARHIPHRKNQQHTPAWHWSSTTNRMVVYESYLESVWMTLLDFDPQVISYSSQPMLLDGVDNLGAWKAYPDLFVRRLDGTGTLVEVKNPEKIADAKVQLTARRVAACAAAAGWGYDLLGAPPHQQTAINVLHLAGYRREMVGVAQYRDRLLALAADPVRFGDLVGFFEDDQVARAVAAHLCWTQELEVDLSEPLEDTTVVRAAR